MQGVGTTMKSYKFLIIHYSGFGSQQGVELYCTDPYSLDWLIEETLKQVPKAKFRFAKKDLEGNYNFFQFFKLGGKDYEIANWLFKCACEEGWLPIDASAPSKSFTTFNDLTFKLRKEQIE